MSDSRDGMSLCVGLKHDCCYWSDKYNKDLHQTRELAAEDRRDKIGRIRELRAENEKLRGVVERLRKSLRDIVENFDCEYVEVDRLRGHHDCQHCLAKKALSESADVMEVKP